MEVEKILIYISNFTFSGKKAMKDLRHERQRKKSINIFKTQHIQNDANNGTKSSLRSSRKHSEC